MKHTEGQLRSPCTLAIVLLMAVAFGAPGCAGKTRRYPAPSPTALLEALTRRQRQVTGLDLETRTETNMSGDRVRATVLMLVARDGRLRFEAEVSLKGTVAVLSANEERYSFVDLERAVFETGPACAENIAALVQLPLRPRAIAALLLGDVSFGPGVRVVRADWDSQAGAEVLELHDPGPAPVDNGPRTEAMDTEAQHYWIWLKHDARARTFFVVRLEGARAGTASPRERYRVLYEDFSHSGGFWFPDRIRFARPGQTLEAGLEIHVRARRLNPTFTEQAFSLVPPSGFSIYNTTCGSAGAATR